MQSNSIFQKITKKRKRIHEKICNWNNFRHWISGLKLDFWNKLLNTSSAISSLPFAREFLPLLSSVLPLRLICFKLIDFNFSRQVSQNWVKELWKQEIHFIVRFMALSFPTSSWPISSGICGILFVVVVLRHFAKFHQVECGNWQHYQWKQTFWLVTALSSSPSTFWMIFVKIRRLLFFTNLPTLSGRIIQIE